MALNPCDFYFFRKSGKKWKFVVDYVIYFSTFVSVRIVLEELWHSSPVNTSVS